MPLCIREVLDQLSDESKLFRGLFEKLLWTNFVNINKWLDGELLSLLNFQITWRVGHSKWAIILFPFYFEYILNSHICHLVFYFNVLLMNVDHSQFILFLVENSLCLAKIGTHLKHLHFLRTTKALMFGRWCLVWPSGEVMNLFNIFFKDLTKKEKKLVGALLTYTYAIRAHNPNLQMQLVWVLLTELFI